MPAKIFAHSVILKESPAPSSTWASPPQKVLPVIYKDDSSIAPIEVPITDSKEDVDHTVYGGFRLFIYIIYGPYLPFAGKWDVEVTVEDKNDVETKYNNEMMLY
jgi:copper transport protein